MKRSKPKPKAKKPRRVVLAKLWKPSMDGPWGCECGTCRYVRGQSELIGKWKTLRILAEILE